MPILENQRHEKFAQQLATGKSASEAYVLAGYKPSRKNASRLRTNEGVVTRVAELQAVAVRSTAITIESICAELDEANQVAKEHGQASAMVSASTLRAKLAGLLRDKVEISTDNGDDYDQPIEVTAAQIAYNRKCLKLTGDDLANFTDHLRQLYQEWSDGIDHWLAAFTAKPVNEARNAAELERRRLAVASRNGR